MMKQSMQNVTVLYITEIVIYYVPYSIRFDVRVVDGSNMFAHVDMPSIDTTIT